MQATELAINSYYTLIAATIVLLFGKFWCRELNFCKISTFPSLWPEAWWLRY